MRSSLEATSAPEPAISCFVVVSVVREEGHIPRLQVIGKKNRRGGKRDHRSHQDHDFLIALGENKGNEHQDHQSERPERDPARANAAYSGIVANRKAIFLNPEARLALNHQNGRPATMVRANSLGSPSVPPGKATRP